MVIITFVHLDLGIGGAERLIVDAAVALKNKKHDVRIITTHHDRSHCFPETVDGTIPVTVVGDWLPRNILGRFGAVFSYIRMVYAALYLVFFNKIDTNVIICDQVSACVPILHWKTNNVIFYCHFPDLLLSKSGSWLKALYRFPLNYIEEKTTGLADTVLVNSQFTKITFKNTFKRLTLEPYVLYPSINEEHLEDVYLNCDGELEEMKLSNLKYFLSVNRYERKKNIGLAIETFTLLLLRKLEPEQRESLKLIIAGGYDSSVVENMEYFQELQSLAKKLKIFDKVVFLKSPTESEKIKLMKCCTAVLYTPDNEHFGIVPLEAMYCSKPVVAVNSGGPTETIVNRETGLLCASNREAFADAMFELMSDEEFCEGLGVAAKVRFEKYFSFVAFSSKLNTYVLQLIEDKPVLHAGKL